LPVGFFSAGPKRQVLRNHAHALRRFIFHGDREEDFGWTESHDIGCLAEKFGNIGERYGSFSDAEPLRGYRDDFLLRSVSLFVEQDPIAVGVEFVQSDHPRCFTNDIFICQLTSETVRIRSGSPKATHLNDR
jgi:hypothetical protein